MTLLFLNEAEKKCMRRVAMFALLLATLCVLSIRACMAQEVPAKPLFDFGTFFHSIRVGYGINQYGVKSSIFYTPLITLHNGNAIDLVSFNIGYEGDLKRPTTLIGFRFDNAVPLLFKNDWGKKHVSLSSLPSFECGPFISVWPKGDGNLWHLDITYGFGLAVGF